MENNIVIKNSDIANYAMFKLDKIDNLFSKSELDKIEELTINFDNSLDNSLLDEIILFQNMKNLTLRNFYISNDKFKILLSLSKLDSISFEKCKFENINLIASLNLRSLSLIGCDIIDYSFINLLNHLHELSLVGGMIEINKINKLKDLEYLQLSYSDIIGDKITINLNNLSELYIDNTNIMDLSFMENLHNLKKLSIDVTQYKNNMQLLSKFSNVNIYNENMIEFNGDYDEI